MKSSKGKPPVAHAHLVDGEIVQMVLDIEGLSQWDFGHRLGWSQTAVGRWIRGTTAVPDIVKHILSCRHCYPHFISRVAVRGPEM